MLKIKNNTLLCFSPPIMIATFLIEIALLLVTLATRKFQKLTILVSLALFSLAFFQLCEYFVCGGLGYGSAVWSRLGFISITTLPPLGLHIMFAIANKKSRYLVPIAYILMALWIALFGFTEVIFNNHVCSGNYVIFNLSVLASYLYTIYYYGLLLLGIWVAAEFKATTKKIAVKQSLTAMILGYVTFMLPTAVVNSITPSTVAGIPSIMCGFAVLFAFIIAVFVVPKLVKRS